MIQRVYREAQASVLAAFVFSLKFEGKKKVEVSRLRPAAVWLDIVVGQATLVRIWPGVGAEDNDDASLKAVPSHRSFVNSVTDVTTDITKYIIALVHCHLAV